MRGANLLQQVIAHLPSRSSAALAQRLVRHADAARDSRQWVAAAALYEEALLLAPYRHRIHIQCGHALKEAGEFLRAENQYLAAAAALPTDANLALQIGHFYATRARPEEAEAAYRRAAILDPALHEAKEALGGLGVRTAAPAAASEDLIPELLPSEGGGSSPRRDQLVITQLGRELDRAGPVRRILRGIEAVRGWCLASVPIERVDLAINGIVVRSAVPERHSVPNPLMPEQAKYAVNIWHDFSAVPAGDALVELRFIEVTGTARIHRVTLLVRPPVARPDLLPSDSYIPTPVPSGMDVEAIVNALPSVRRPGLRLAPFAAPRAVLVQRVDQIGDLVASEPALSRLRSLFPDAKLVGLLSPANAELARTLPYLDAVEVVHLQEDAASGRRSLSADAQADLRRRLRAYGFGVAIDLGEGDTSRPLLRLSGAPFLYGFRPRDFPWLSGGIEADLRDPVNGHEAAAHSRRLLALVEGLATLADRPTQIIEGQSLAPERLAAYGLSPDRPYAVLHTGARLSFSRWPGYASLARLLIERTDLDLLMMREEDDAPLDLPSSHRVQTTWGRLPFAEFDALLSGAAVLIGNDSGPKHLAALRGTPVVSVHSARINWSEWGQELTGTVISRRVPCAGCGIAANTEECGKEFACIRLIHPEEVFAAVQELLASPVNWRSPEP